MTTTVRNVKILKFARYEKKLKFGTDGSFFFAKLLPSFLSSVVVSLPTKKSRVKGKKKV